MNRGFMATFSGLQGGARTIDWNELILSSNSVLYLQDACSVVSRNLEGITLDAMQRSSPSSARGRNH
jgi:hypothetical protein